MTRPSSPRPRPVPIEVVVGQLTDRIDGLVRTVLPNGQRRGSEWYVHSVAGEPGDNLGVHLTGAKAGVWMDFRYPDRSVAGDPLDLVAHVLFDRDKKAALRWAREWLGLDGTVPDAALAEARRKTAAQRDHRERQAEAEDTRTRDNVMGIWLAAQPTLKGTPVERYLAGRGILLARLGRQPGALRFHPELYNAETGGRHWPAMVAGIVGPAGSKIAAVHRTWLADGGEGRVVKLPVANPKMTLGRYAGGSIRIWRGASGKPIREAPAGERVVVTEGIEDALTIAQEVPEVRVLCAVSLANVAHLVLPPSIGSLTIVADNDAPGSPAERGLWRSVRMQRERGLRVLIGRPPAGVKDVNELLQKAERVA